MNVNDGIHPRVKFAPGAQGAYKLIEDLEEVTEFMADLDVDTPTLERDADGAVTGIQLTGAAYAALGAYIAGPQPTGGPTLKVESVTMTLDMFETLLYLVTKRATERPS